MRRAFLRRPSASMSVAIIALVVAASGTAVAASTLVNGDKLIKKGTLSGNRLRNHTITETQVNLSKLGTVPSASNANHANSADNATNATNASNAAELGSQPASAYMPANRLIQSGMVNLTAPASSGQSTSQTLLTAGPFTVTGKCINEGASGTSAEVDATSTAANSNLGGSYEATAGTAAQLDTAQSTGQITDSAGYDYNGTLLTPTGRGYTLIGVDIVNPNDAHGTCRFDLQALLLS